VSQGLLAALARGLLPSAPRPSPANSGAGPLRRPSRMTIPPRWESVAHWCDPAPCMRSRWPLSTGCESTGSSSSDMATEFSRNQAALGGKT
jgi:hypothetical protein